jgi:cell division protein FtsI (penicillin-binding protein 3)
MFSKRRLAIMAALITMLFVTAVLRTAQVQVIEFPAYAVEINQQQLAYVNTLAPRGTIFDRNGNVMAVSNRAFIVRMNGRRITDLATAAKFAQAIAPTLNLTPDTLLERMTAIIEDSKQLTPTIQNIIAYDVQPAMIKPFRKAIRENRIGDTIWEEEHWTRAYPFGPIAGPTVGFVTLYGDNYSGVEASANRELAETRGHRTKRTRLDLVEVTPTLSGADIVLTLDLNLQTYVEQRLAQAIKESGAQSGSVLVMETSTGRILSSASWPGYNPNRVHDLAADPDTAKWLKDPAVTDMFEPGSVIKICTIAAAIDAGAVSPDQIFHDPGRIVVEGAPIRNSDRAAHGNVDLTTTLAKSLNVVTVQVAQKMGPDQFYRGMHAFGFGTRTGIDLGGESAGALRTPTDEQWSKIDLATHSYGQGMATNSYQVLNAFNAVANDGMLMQPYVIQEWRDADGNVIEKKPVTLQQSVSPETAAIVRRMMMRATMSATPQVAPKGYTVAGKTGTADWYLRRIKQETTIVTYAGFIPAEHPKLTILVKLDQPTSSRWAKDTTVPVFHDVAEKAVRLLGVAPDLVDDEAGLEKSGQGGGGRR